MTLAMAPPTPSEPDLPFAAPPSAPSMPAGYKYLYCLAARLPPPCRPNWLSIICTVPKGPAAVCVKVCVCVCVSECGEAKGTHSGTGRV